MKKEIAYRLPLKTKHFSSVPGEFNIIDLMKNTAL